MDPTDLLNEVLRLARAIQALDDSIAESPNGEPEMGQLRRLADIAPDLADKVLELHAHLVAGGAPPQGWVPVPTTKPEVPTSSQPNSCEAVLIDIKQRLQALEEHVFSDGK